MRRCVCVCVSRILLNEGAITQVGPQGQKDKRNYINDTNDLSTLLGHVGGKLEINWNG